MSNYVPLRERDNLPDEVRRILSVRRHVANPWTEEDALVVARWRGYEPTEPWPGNVGLPWRGICLLGHQCGPTFANVLVGRPPCGRDGHIKEEPGVRRSPKRPSVRERRAETAEKVMRIAAERGHVIHAIDARPTAGGVVGALRKTFVTVEYECGHVSENLAIPADRYIARHGGGCLVCNPNKFMRGVNELERVRPDLAAQLVDPSLGGRLAVASNKKVEWRCDHCRHQWFATVQSRSVLWSGCPACGPGGGYSPDHPGSIYVVSGASRRTGERLIKVGITNIPEARLYRHHRQGLTLVEGLLTWSDGAVAPGIESSWKGVYRYSLPKALHASNKDLPDGHREAVRDSDEAREALQQFLAFASEQSANSLTYRHMKDAVDHRSTSFNNASGLSNQLEPHP